MFGRVVGDRVMGDWVHSAWELVGRWGTIGPDTRRGCLFGSFGRGSAICFPPGTIITSSGETLTWKRLCRSAATASRKGRMPLAGV